jgi:hypothetical protein
MDSVAIFPVFSSNGPPVFRAIAGAALCEGRTAGEALDAIRDQLPATGAATFVIIQPFEPDRWFAAEKRQRLADLMGRWRGARDTGQRLSDAEQAELESLIEAELKAAAARTQEALQGLRK